MEVDGGIRRGGGRLLDAGRAEPGAQLGRYGPRERWRRGADLCLAATLQVFQRDATSNKTAGREPYRSPDTMMPAAPPGCARPASVHARRRSGDPAYTGVLARHRCGPRCGTGPVRFSPRSRVAHEHPAMPRPLRLCVSASRGDARLLRGAIVLSVVLANPICRAISVLLRLPVT
ncbi:MAG: hypothetical protein ACLTSX_13425 [Collinsella sp.]